MTRRWVKEELRKNPIRDFIVKVIKYFRDNKNYFYIALAIVAVIGLFIFVTVRNRREANRDASLIYAEAQDAVSRFNYERAIERLEQIETAYGNTKVVDQALYLKAQVFYKRGDMEQAAVILKDAVDRYSKSKIKPEMLVMLGSAYENLQRYDMAEASYIRIKEESYLYPEALSGMARIKYEQENIQEAINLYTRVASHFTGTYWGDKAKEILAHLGVKPQVEPEDIPALNLR
ncbi:MAG: DUF2989 domain-containing protein [Elusimicrobiota bacterium]|nr:DUF2989 domain-containing protein [Elusimicrobiota bacterium]